MNTESTPARKIFIEQHKRFSESCLWRLQKEYFDKEGINAWVSSVPFYITSNPFIANCYAHVVFSFILDYTNQNPDAKNHPFYMLELGTGSGRFSFYVIKKLAELLKEHDMEDISVCYVMSDFTKHNVQYYETHHALLPYIEKGMIDFAIYDASSERPITLIRKNIKLDNATLVNPLTVFANYLFDTVPHDSFAVYDKKLYELQVSVSTDESNMDHNRPINMEQLSVEHNLREIKSNNYYSEPALDNILEIYKNSLQESSFLIPIDSIRAIKYLRKISNDKLLLISTDKGYSTIPGLDNLGHPSVVFHGSFSMMVNYHAISEFFKQTGGDAFLQTPRKGIKTSVFASGFNLKDMPNTEIAINDYVEGFSPGDYFILHRRISETFESCDLDTIASHMQLAEWDPHIYLRLSARISALTPEGDSDTLIFMAANMPKLAANYYYLPKSECVLFEIAIFFHSIKNFQTALEYYRKAEPFVGEQYGLFYNIALCLHHLDQNEEALTYFKRALQIDPESKETIEWITYIEKGAGSSEQAPGTPVE